MSDLDSVISISESMEQADPDVFDFGLFDALIVIYGRGFGSGASHQPRTSRVSLESFVESLNSEEQEQHLRLLDVRNRQVAHRVDSGVAFMAAVFNADGSFHSFESLHSGVPVGMKLVWDAKRLAGRFRELALTERERRLDALSEIWSSKTLSSEQLEAADRAFVEHLKAGEGRR